MKSIDEAELGLREILYDVRDLCVSLKGNIVLEFMPKFEHSLAKVRILDNINM